MPFTSKTRCCRKFTGSGLFKPSGLRVRKADTIEISLDEIEAMKLCDGERRSQLDAARAMNISTGTVQRLLYSGRRKTVEALCCAHPLKVVIPDNIVYTGTTRYKKSGDQRTAR